MSKHQAAPIRVSRRLYEAVKLFPDPAYRVAQRAGVNPTVLSRLLHGNAQIRLGDPRVLAVARVVGVPPEHAFAPSESDATELAR